MKTQCLLKKQINFFSTSFNSFRIKISLFKYNLKPIFYTSFWSSSTKGYSVVKNGFKCRVSISTKPNLCLRYILCLRDQPESKQDILTALIRWFMMIGIIILFGHMIFNIIVIVFSDFLKQMFMSRPNLTCSVLKFDVLFTLADICFMGIQCFRAFSLLRPYEYHALNHDRNSFIKLILPAKSYFIPTVYSITFWKHEIGVVEGMCECSPRPLLCCTQI